MRSSSTRRARCGEPLPELDRHAAGSARVRRATRATSSRSATSRSWATSSPRRCCTAPFASRTIPAPASCASTRRGPRPIPACVAVLTAADVPGERTQGTLTKDWRQLVAEGETTAYVGDVLAAVAAESRHAAREAADARRRRVRGARARDRPVRGAGPSRAEAARERQRALGLARAARRRRRRARGCGARRGGDLPHAVHRARVPRAGVRASSCRRTTEGSRSTRRARASGRTGGRSRRSSACPRSRCG